MRSELRARRRINLSYPQPHDFGLSQQPGQADTEIAVRGIHGDAAVVVEIGNPLRREIVVVKDQDDVIWAEFCEQ